MTELLFTVPFGIYQIYANLQGGAAPWQGWANTHYDFSRVDLYPAVLWKSDPAFTIPLQISRWMLPACAFIFFAFFGFAEEARRRYYTIYCVVGARLHAMRILSFRSSVSHPSYVFRPRLHLGSLIRLFRKLASFEPKASFATEESLPAYCPPARSPGWRSLASVTVADSDSSPIKTSFSDKFPSDLRHTPYDQC